MIWLSFKTVLEAFVIGFVCGIVATLFGIAGILACGAKRKRAPK